MTLGRVAAGGRALSAALMLAAVGGCQADANGHGAARAAIVEGTVSDADRAVVAVTWRRLGCGEERPGVVCTGTVVAPRAVLTAAHCLPADGSGAALEVYFGPEVGEGGDYRVVVATRAHPGYDPATDANDAALLVLDSPAPVEPVPLRTGSIADVAAGAELRAVGYGATDRDAADEGRRRTGTLLLDSVEAGSFEALAGPSMTCTGDSGGPVFAAIGGEEQLLGITSLGDFTCRTRATNQRVDAVLDEFLRPGVEAAADAPDGWPEGAPAIDTLEGFECLDSSACPAALACLDGTCGLPGLGPGTFGPACGVDSDCGDAECARLWPQGPDACHCFTSEAAVPPPPGDGGGCSAARGRGAGAWVALGCLLGLLGWRRRCLPMSSAAPERPRWTAHDW